MPLNIFLYHAFIFKKQNNNNNKRPYHSRLSENEFKMSYLLIKVFFIIPLDTLKEHSYNKIEGRFYIASFVSDLECKGLEVMKFSKTVYGLKLFLASQLKKVLCFIIICRYFSILHF